MLCPASRSCAPRGQQPASRQGVRISLELCSLTLVPGPACAPRSLEPAGPCECDPHWWQALGLVREALALAGRLLSRPVADASLPVAQATRCGRGVAAVALAATWFPLRGFRGGPGLRAAACSPPTSCFLDLGILGPLDPLLRKWREPCVLPSYGSRGFI